MNHGGRGTEKIWSERSRLLWHCAAVGLLAWTAAVFCAAPSLYFFKLSEIFSTRAGDFVRQCANPLTREITGAPFLGYRVFAPTVAWLIGARLYWALALPYFATVAFLSVLCLAVSKRHGRNLGTVATMLVASSYAVTWPDCMLGYPDSVAHLLAACLLLARRPWLIAAITTAGLLTDERFILEVPFVFLWHWAGPTERDASWPIAAWRPVLFGAVFCLLVRRALTLGWIGPGIDQPRTYGDIANTLFSLHPFNMTWTVWLLNVFIGFRWAWIVVVAGFMARIRRPRSPDAWVFLGVLLACVAASMLVFDTARSIGFCYLAVVLPLSWLAESAPDVARKLGKWTAWLSFLTPCLWFVPGYAIWFRPLPLRVYAFVTNHDPLAWFPWIRNVH